MIGIWNAILILTLTEIDSMYGKLSGDHICVAEKTFLVNSTEFYIKNFTVRNYKWCLNYPPRCSYYTINKVNTTRVTEKNETQLVEECCPNFKENQGKCISLCKNCEKGICENGSCTCFTGFKGEYCDLECSFNEWGPNCSKQCDCNNRTCDSITGSCFKNYTTSTIPVTAHTSSIPQDSRHNNDYHFITESNEKVTVNKNQLRPKNTDVLYEQVTDNVTVTLLQKNITDNYKDIDLNASVSSRFPFSTTESIILANTTDETVSITKLSGNSTTTDSLKFFNIAKQSIKDTENIFPIKTYPNGTIATKIGLLIPVKIQYDKLQTVLSNDTRLFSNEEYLNRQVYKNDFLSKDVILFTIAIMVAFVGVLAILMISIMRKRKLNQSVQHENRQVAVFSTAIFESPLPAIREYEYDHPASTGSYNATPVFNPVELKSHQFVEQNSEPIYDEIPHKEFEQSCNNTHSAIYVNTLGRTKL